MPLLSALCCVQVMHFRQQAGVALGSSGLLGQLHQAALQPAPASPRMVMRSASGGLGGPPQRAISAPASELWAYAAELAAEVAAPAGPAPHAQQQWQRPQSGNLSDDFSFHLDWTAPSQPPQSPVLSSAAAPTQHQAPQQQYW